MPSRTTRVLDVPEQYRQGLALLAKLSDVSFDELQSALKKAPEVGSRKELAAWLTSDTKSLSQTDLQLIIDALTSLYRVRVSVEVAAEKLANDVATAMSESGPQEFRVANENRATFSGRLANLIVLRSLDVADTKAQDLKTEYDHTFCDCRILTDLRPVFGTSISEAPTRMLIVHTLKLGYHDSTERKHKEFFIALDSTDLIALKDAIQRAQTKAQTLKSQLESAGVKPIEVE